MANSFDDLIPKLIAGAMPIIRTHAVLPRLVTRDYQGMAAQKGSTIDVPITPTMTSRDVTPGPTPPANQDTTEGVVSITLDKWRECTFHMTDKELAELADGQYPKKAAAAAATLADYVDTQLFTCISEGAGIALGTAGTDPFASLALAQEVNTELNQRSALKTGRHCVFNALAEANLIALDTFANSDFVGDVTAMTEGAFNENGRRLGANWWQDENAPTHTKGTGASFLVNGALAEGATTITADGGSGTILAGDVVTFAADTDNKYVVTEALSGGSFKIGGVGLRVAIPDNNAITVNNNHTVNVAFHTDAVALVTRELQTDGGNPDVMSMTDPMTGLTIRLERLRGWRQTTYAFDVLFGCKVVESKHAIKVMG